MTNVGFMLRRELRALVPVTVFFFVSFQLLALTEALILRQYVVRTPAFLGATLTALVMAKVVLIADKVPGVNRFPHKPLAYNVVWKTAIYFCAALAVRYVEHLVRFWRRTGDLAEANRRLFDEIVWTHFAGVQIWLLVLITVYCAARELARAVGRERIIRLYFHDPSPGSPDR